MRPFRNLLVNVLRVAANDPLWRTQDGMVALWWITVSLLIFVALALTH